MKPSVVNGCVWEPVNISGNVSFAISANPLLIDANLDSDGDGISDLQEIAIGTNPNSGSDGTDDTDSQDGDNISNLEEIQAPNGGDGNDDGILDAVQDTVSSFVNNVSSGNVYNTLEITGGACASITNIASIGEGSLSAQDTDFVYPEGLWDFTLNCPGSTVATPSVASVQFILDESINLSNLELRKFNTTTQEYTDITASVVLDTATVNGRNITTVSYDITDNGPLDEDPTIGIIRDPVGLAAPAPVVVNNVGWWRNYACRDPEASNFSRFGFSDPDLCEYDNRTSVADSTTNDNNQEEKQEDQANTDRSVPDDSDDQDTQQSDLEKQVADILDEIWAGEKSEDSNASSSKTSDEYTMENSFDHCSVVGDIQNIDYQYQSSGIFLDEDDSSYKDAIVKFCSDRYCKWI